MCELVSPTEADSHTRTTNINCPLRVGLLDDTDCRVRDEDEQNDEGLYERAPPTGALRVLKECEDERHDSGCQEDEDELVLELFEDELP